MDELEQEVTGSPKTRDSIEEQLAERRAEETKDEFVPMPSETEEPVAEVHEPETPAEPVAEVPAAPETVTVKVDGQEFQLPKDRVDAEGGVEVVQMKLAAAKRLEEARIEAARIKEEAAKAANPQAASATEQIDEAQLIEKVRFGSEAEAKEAIRKLVGQNQPDPQALMPLVQQEIAKNQAVEAFKRDFPEIVKDPYMARLAVDMEVEARRTGDRRPHHELYQAIGKSLTDWRGKMAGSFKEKQEKKATVTPIPQAQAKAKLPEEPRAQTRAEILEEERRARKQA